jgi:hypothetical protein
VNEGMIFSGGIPLPVPPSDEERARRIAKFVEIVESAAKIRREICVHCLFARTCGKSAQETLDCEDVKKAFLMRGGRI